MDESKNYIFISVKTTFLFYIVLMMVLTMINLFEGATSDWLDIEKNWFSIIVLGQMIVWLLFTLLVFQFIDSIEKIKLSIKKKPNHKEGEKQ